MLANAMFAPSTVKPQLMLETLKVQDNTVIHIYFFKGKTCKTKALSVATRGQAFPLDVVEHMLPLSALYKDHIFNTLVILFPPEQGQKQSRLQASIRPVTFCLAGLKNGASHSHARTICILPWLQMLYGILTEP